MEEDCRLGDPGRPEVFVTSFKHYVSDIESEDIIGPEHHLTGPVAAFKEVFAHSRELGTLTWKHKYCLHNRVIPLTIGQTFGKNKENS